MRINYMFYAVKVAGLCLRGSCYETTWIEIYTVLTYLNSSYVMVLWKPMVRGITVDLLF